MAEDSKIVSVRFSRAPIAGDKIAAWLIQFDRSLKEEGLSRRAVCTIVADVARGKDSERQWVGDARFADILLWLACRGDAGVIRRISSGMPSLDFHVDVYAWGEVDVWLSADPTR